MKNKCNIRSEKKLEQFEVKNHKLSIKNESKSVVRLLSAQKNLKE